MRMAAARRARTENCRQCRAGVARPGPPSERTPFRLTLSSRLAPSPAASTPHQSIVWERRRHRAGRVRPAHTISVATTTNMPCHLVPCAAAAKAGREGALKSSEEDEDDKEELDPDAPPHDSRPPSASMPRAVPRRVPVRGRCAAPAAPAPHAARTAPSPPVQELRAQPSQPNPTTERTESGGKTATSSQ